MEFFADLLATIGGAAADTGSKTCVFVMLDEPECPESLIK